MGSDLAISMETPRLPEAVSKGENKKRKQKNKKRKQKNKKRKQADMASDLDSYPPVISGDDDDDDDAGFLSGGGVCTFPFLAVIPERPDPVYELSFIDNKDRKFKMSMPRSSNIDAYTLVGTNGSWIMFVRCDGDGTVIIFDPATRNKLEDFPPIYRFLSDACILYLADNLTAFAAAFRDRGICLATATSGDEKWSVIEIPCFHQIMGVVSHKADGKFYAMDSRGKLMRFGLTRSRKSKTSAVCDQHLLAKGAKGERLGRPYLLSDGINLLQLREGFRSKGIFEILSYCPVKDAWTDMTRVDLGNNSIFIDWYGAKLLPTPPAPPTKDKDKEKGGRVMRRNCIYSIHHKKIPPFPNKAAEDAARARFEREQYEKETDFLDDFDEVKREKLYSPRARIHDLTKGVVESCFTTDIQSRCLGLEPPLMWFMPSSSINN